MITKRKAQITLQQDAINRLVSGKTVWIRAGHEIEIELRFDPNARVGQGSLEDLVADVLRTKCS